MAAPSAPLAVAVAQSLPGEDTAANLDEIARLAGEAASRGALLVAFPEYSSFFSPRFGAEIVAAGQSLHGPFVRHLGEIARELGIHLVAGMLERIEGEERVANTLVAVGPEGDLVATYRKTHLYDAFGSAESEWIHAGPLDQRPVFEVGGIRVGLQTCYDVRFPEVTRRLVDAGAELVVIPAQWVPGPRKELHWRTLVTARAIENTVFVAAPGHAAPQGVGTSLVLDPMGAELVTLGEGVDVGVAWITRARLDEVRHRNPALRLRRYDVVPRA